MKEIIAVFCAVCLLYPTTFFAQDMYQYGNGEEIPLDDFPQYASGYRVQLGAFSSEAFARVVKDSLAGEIGRRVHLRYADGFWKVRIGDFQQREAAEYFLKMKLLPLGYHSAKIVEDKVKLPPWRKPERAKTDGFRLQVSSLSDRDQALELGRKLDFNYPDIRAYVVHRDGLYKIQLGDFRTRAEIEDWKKKSKGIPDLNVWIVPAQVYEDPPPSPLERPVMDPFEFND